MARGEAGGNARQVEVEAFGGRGQVAAGALIAAVVLVGTIGVAVTNRWSTSTSAALDIPTTEVMAVGLLNTYALPFEVASILLLVAMIGALVIARED